MFRKAFDKFEGGYIGPGGQILRHRVLQKLCGGGHAVSSESRRVLPGTEIHVEGQDLGVLEYWH